MSPTQVKILVPGNHLMVELLGHRDQLLRLVEEAFGDTEILVRGNEISISGGEADRAGRLFDESSSSWAGANASTPPTWGGPSRW